MTNILITVFRVIIATALMLVFVPIVICWWLVTKFVDWRIWKTEPTVVSVTRVYYPVWSPNTYPFFKLPWLGRDGSRYSTLDEYYRAHPEDGGCIHYSDGTHKFLYTPEPLVKSSMFEPESGYVYAPYVPTAADVCKKAD